MMKFVCILPHALVPMGLIIRPHATKLQEGKTKRALKALEKS
jgi:hypothetical protein